MVRCTAPFRAALALAGGLALVHPAAAAPAPAPSSRPAPPGAAVEKAPAADLQVGLQVELESLLCALLSPLCGLIDGSGNGEEGSSMDPFGAR